MIDPEDDPRPVWQLAAEEGTKEAAIRELMLDNWPHMSKSEARAAVKLHRKNFREKYPQVDHSEGLGRS